MRIKTHHTPKIFGLILAFGVMIAGGFYVSQNAQAATMTDYNIAKTDPLNLAYHMDEPLYTAIYDTYNNTGSPNLLDADQDGTITLVEAGGWSGNSIVLNGSGLTGTLRGIENFVSLRTLNLHTNQLTGQIPDDIGNLDKLTSLSLRNNQLTGVIPDSIANLTNLTTLQLSSNQLTGEIPSSLGNLTNLTGLQLQDNSLSGSIPEEIFSLTNLTALNLSNNQLTGQISDDIGNLAKLTDLALHDNPLGGSIPDSIGNLVDLKTLYLNGNQFVGSIPSSIGNLTNLTILNLYSNRLTGEIPDSIGSMTELTGLRLWGNQLTGAIPDSIANLTNLTTLQLQVNQLTGQIPDGIGSLTNLTSLYLHENQLSGPIPDSVGDLANLAVLNLGENQLSGSVPASFANLDSLTSIYLTFNNLSGTLPTIAAGSPGVAVYAPFNANLVTPNCSSIPANYTNFVNYYTAVGNEECNIDTPSTNTNYATVDPQDGSTMILRQDVDGDGRADVNLQPDNTRPSYFIDVNGDGVADINILVFPELASRLVFNAGTAITVSDGFAGWIPANMSLGAGTWTKADFRVSPNYPYYLEAVTPGALVLNSNPAPLILNITKCGTNNDVNGDGVPDYNIDINNDGIVDYRAKADICGALGDKSVSAPNTGADGMLGDSGRVIPSILGIVSVATLFLALFLGRKIIAKRR